MIKIAEKEKCCGCSACAQVCPKQCIRMRIDREGFQYPHVDSRACINCGLCEKVCPINADNNRIKKDPKATFIAYSENCDVRMKSSSGGIFTELAEHTINNGGIVFGAAFDFDFSVHHVSVETTQRLKELQGSKYLQSRIENSYSEAKAALEQGQKVLFSGTPCQLAGLMSFLHKDYSNLITVDVLCHGVPSPMVWKKYVKEQEHSFGAKLKSVSFRDKTKGWKKYFVRLEFKNQKHLEQIHYENTFMRLFLSNVCLRPSCYECLFKTMDRPADITLGDCWGVEGHSPEMDDDRGTSVVIIHSSKGEALINAIRNRINIKQCELDVALPLESDSRKSVKKPLKRDSFFFQIRFFSVKNALKRMDANLLQRIIRKLFRVMKRILQLR